MEEQWRRIPGIDDRYEVSNFGNFRRRLLDGRYKQVNPFPVRYRNSRTQLMRVTIRSEGKILQLSASRVVWSAFVGEIPEGHVIYHKNRSVIDNHIENLGILPRQEFEKRTKSRPRRPVIKTMPDGEEVMYRSVKEAAKKNYYSEERIIHRCRTGEPAPDGAIYRYDD